MLDVDTMAGACDELWQMLPRPTSTSTQAHTHTASWFPSNEVQAVSRTREAWVLLRSRRVLHYWRWTLHDSVRDGSTHARRADVVTLEGWTPRQLALHLRSRHDAIDVSWGKQSSRTLIDGSLREHAAGDESVSGYRLMSPAVACWLISIRGYR